MTPTVTRWEWRTFGDHFGQVNDQLEALASSGEEQSEELYFLSPTGENIKVRGDSWTSRCSARSTVQACSGGSRW